MRIPKRPPASLKDVYENPTKLTSVMGLVSSEGSHGEYLHWDKMQFKPLPEGLPEGTTREEYWLATKIRRMTTLKVLPFSPKNKDDRPFSFSRSDCLLMELRHIDVKAGGAVSTNEDVIGRKDGERYLTRSVLEEPFSSSVLEGAATTRVKAQAIIEKGEPAITRDERMVLNNYKAMMFIKEHIDDDLTPEIILECHKIITEGTLDRPEMSGQYRDTNDIVVGDDYGEVFHVPPDFKEMKERIQALCLFANQTEADDVPYIHPITRAIILHFMLAYDHPFVDGNGRTARALFYWYALRSGYWMMEYVSISKIIKNAPTQYGMAFLYTETDDNDVTYFIMHQLRVIKKAIAELELYLDRQKAKYRATEKLLTEETFNHRQKYVLSEFIRGRITSITILDHHKKQGVSYLTARKDLEGLEDDGWLIKVIEGRKNIYHAGKALGKLNA